MNPGYKAFCTVHSIARRTIGLFVRAEAVGRENIPEGAAVLCANHSSWSDPFLLWFAATKKHFLHIMAKAELFKIPVLSFFMRQLSVIPVDRGHSDVQAIKSSLRCLKEGGKLGIFPEGTRAKEDNVIEAKRGAVRIADRAGVPVVPVYIPRKKKLFRKTTVIIGKPYYVNPEKAKLAPDDYLRIAEELMEKIYALKAEEKN